VPARCCTAVERQSAALLCWWTLAKRVSSFHLTSSFFFFALLEQPANKKGFHQLFNISSAAPYYCVRIGKTSNKNVRVKFPFRWCARYSLSIFWNWEFTYVKRHFFWMEPISVSTRDIWKIKINGKTQPEIN
jgi:hypothetical protein